MPPSLVGATIEDMPQVARLFRESRETELSYLPKLHTPEKDLNFFTSVVFPHQKIELLKDATDILGFIAYDDNWIHHLYLAPGEIGKGYATQLLDAALAAGRQKNLWTFKRNTRAIKFYEKHGFCIVKETDGAENEEREPDVLMQSNMLL